MATSRGHSGEGVARGARCGLSGQIRGIPVLRRNSGNVLRTLSQSLCAVGVGSVFFGWSSFPPGRTWGAGRHSVLFPGSPRPAVALSCRTSQSRYLERESGEDRPISGIVSRVGRLDGMWRFSLGGGGSPCCPSLPPSFLQRCIFVGVFFCSLILCHLMLTAQVKFYAS